MVAWCELCKGRGRRGWFPPRVCERCAGTGRTSAPDVKPPPPPELPRLHVRESCSVCARHRRRRTQLIGGPYDGATVDLYSGTAALEYRIPRATLHGRVMLGANMSAEGIVDLGGGEPGPRVVYRREDHADGTFVYRHTGLEVIV